MNILMANASWYPSGGDWTYVDSICKIYEGEGHHIVPFAMQDERNYPSEYEKYFLSNIDYKELNNNKSITSGLKVLGRSFYSREAVKKLNALLANVNVDIAQFNNIHNIHTPSIIPVLKKRNIPIVWRVLDYKLICPNRTFLSNDEVCEACFKKKYYNCIGKRCKKQSVLASTIAALESYCYSILPYYDQVDYFLFQSEFSRDLFIKFGFNPEKAIIVRNPYDASLSSPQFNSQDYILYFGRISQEKGLITLLESMKMLPNILLKIIGNGPQQGLLESFVQANNLKNVEFLGAMWGQELEDVLMKSRFVVLPSEWYEPSPYVILQSYSFGKPVIGTRIGGIQDMIKDNETGMLVPAKNALILSEAISELYKNKAKVSAMGKAARIFLDQNYAPELYYEKTMGLFEQLIKKNRK